MTLEFIDSGMHDQVCNLRWNAEYELSDPLWEVSEKSSMPVRRTLHPVMSLLHETRFSQARSQDTGPSPNYRSLLCHHVPSHQE